MWYRILVAAVLSLATCSQSLANELILNGLAPYQYLNKTIYLASFYAEQPITSTRQFATDTGAKRMVIKVSADTWSPRQFNQMWKQDIAINNNLQAHPDVIDLITAFTETPDEDLFRGDTIVVDYTPGQGTRITLNKADWLQSDNDQLFRTLANAWLGEIPTSQRFQEAMLAGGVFANHPAHSQWVDQSDTLTIAPDRLNLLASFGGESVAARRQAEQQAAEEAERQAALAEQEAQRQRDAARLAEAREQARLLAEARARAETEAAELARARAQANAEAQALEQARVQANAARRAQELANAQVLAEAQAEAERRERLNELSEEERQSRLQAYQTRLQNQILSQVEYPYWAENLGQEGQVALQLSITADGRVGRMEFTERSRHAVLNKALEDAVTRASPFESIPPELNLPETDLTVHHEFAIN